MPGTVVMLRNPFRPERDRDVIAVAEPLTIREWLDEQGIREAGTDEARTGRRQDWFERPTICLRNGSPVLRGRWDGTLIADGDLVVFVPLPQGGGGGGKKPAPHHPHARRHGRRALSGRAHRRRHRRHLHHRHLADHRRRRAGRHDAGQCPAAAAQARRAELRQGRAFAEPDLFADRPGQSGPPYPADPRGLRPPPGLPRSRRHALGRIRERRAIPASAALHRPGRARGRADPHRGHADRLLRGDRDRARATRRCRYPVRDRRGHRARDRRPGVDRRERPRDGARTAGLAPSPPTRRAQMPPGSASMW